ncbi:hypothetical protein GCM10029992_19240 [Glycomyces albus]
MGAAEVFEGGQQGLADGGVVLAEGPELAVVAAELPQDRDDLFDVVDVADHGPQGAHELVALRGHVHREHVACLGVGQEQRRVEVQGHLVAVRGDQAPVLLQPLGVDHGPRRPPR